MINKKTKFIFLTGGVLSGLGKGVSVASIGRLLKSCGYKVFAQKFDPYYNVDPSTMSPYQHGEVFVTIDGAETDLDLGHYERFIGEKCTKKSNYVHGKLLQELIEEERNGVYGGNTIQVIPHVTNKIINKIEGAALSSNADFVITEIGGTVGDIESLPFVSAISQFAHKHKNSSFFIHTTFVPYLESSNEFKSKPTQNSISKLQSMGILPNVILLRSNKKITNDIVQKISCKSFLEKDNLIPVPNVDNIYKIPLYFESYKMSSKIQDFFKMPIKNALLDDWKKYISLIELEKSKTINIHLVGKYIEFEDAYKSIIEALNISSNYNNVKIIKNWIQADNLTKNNIDQKLKDTDGVIILPGFGKRGFEGKVLTAQYTREKDIPTLGICFGMQAMTVAQSIEKGIKDATSSEISNSGSFVIDIIKDKKINNNKIGGTLRLGESEIKIKKNTLTHKLYKSETIFERHRHRFEVNSKFVDKIEDQNFIFSGKDIKTNLIEICEMPNKKFYIGIQAHPEFNANPLKEHPIFAGFIKSIIQN